MKRNYKMILAIVAISATLFAFKASDLTSKKFSNNPDKDRLLLELVMYVLERGHYDPSALDDEFSKGLYKDFIGTLDPSRRFFLQSDIDEFNVFETALDDQIKNKDVSFFNLAYERYVLRSKESKDYYREILSKPFDYTIDESIDTDYDKIPYATTKEDLKERWRKQIKLSTLSNLVDKLDIQDKAKPTDSIKIEIKTLAQLEKETRESSLKSLDEFYGFIEELDRNDWFGFFVNAITSRFDPHTNYMAPNDKERFDVSMTGKYEGIGARLQKKNDYTEIVELLSGSPVWRDKSLDPGDVLLKVAQDNEEAIDVVGMRLENIVKMIKGPKGTKVHLTVKKVDGLIKVVTVIRDTIETEETYARSSIVEFNGIRYGIIYLPKFYIDFEDRNGRDAAKDVKKEIENLKAENVAGIIMDVRDNGGGSLKTVVDITGYFIDQGPVVQVKSAGTRKEVLSDRDPSVQWDGPLVVLVNNFSASASEILAAAIQDYKRGVVLGSKQTYGKGTVQNVFDLNQMLRSNDLGDMGALKTTTQKFYRINGGSTQLEGVASDVVIPDRYSYINIGERDLENAMPWTKIESANYTIWDKQLDIQDVIENSKKRMDTSSYFKLMDENARWIKNQRDVFVYSLEMNKFREEKKKNEDTGAKFKKLNEGTTKLEFKAIQADKKHMDSDDLFKETRERWYKNLSKDMYVEEAIHVLNDMIVKNNTSQGSSKSKEKKKKVK